MTLRLSPLLGVLVLTLPLIAACSSKSSRVRPLPPAPTGPVVNQPLPDAPGLTNEDPDAPPPPQAAGPVTVRGGAGAPAETPTPRQSALADRAEVEKFVRENGARRFEPGTIDSLALAAFEASGMTAALKYDKSVRFWLIDGERRTYASGIDTANRLRAKRGLEPLTQRSGLEAA